MTRYAALILAFAASACAASNGPSARQEEKLSFRPVGEAVSCVPLTSIRQTRVLDDRTIDFLLIGDRRLRNTLPVSCSGLRQDSGITYSTSLARLCNVDTFTVIRPLGGTVLPGATCGLGAFQPVERVTR